MINLTREEFIDELREFIKFIRKLTFLFIVSFIVMLVPVNMSSQQPLSMYLLNSLIHTPLFNITDITIIAGELQGPILVILSASLFFAVLVSSPIAIAMFYNYIRAELEPHEKKMAIKLALAVAGLFYAGIIYGFLVIAPLTVKIMVMLTSVAGAEPVVTITSYYEFIIFSVIATAVGFLIPVAIYVVTKTFKIDLKIRSNWRYIFVAGYCATAVLTPDPTPITALLIIGPPLAMSITAEMLARKARNT